MLRPPVLFNASRSGTIATDRCYWGGLGLENDSCVALELQVEFCNKVKFGT